MMNILYFFAEDESYMSQWQRIHIFDELSHHGYSIEVFNPLNFRNVTEGNEKLSDYINGSSKKFDLFMTCVDSDTLFINTIEDIKKMGLPTMLICFDNLHAPYMHKMIASCFDLVWLTSYETKWLFEKWGCENIVVQPYAANPFKFQPSRNSTIPSVCFIGTPYGGRINKINVLTDSDIQCDIYTNDIESAAASSKFDIKHYNNLLEDTINLLKFRIGRKVLLGLLKNKIFDEKSILHFNSNLKLNSSVSFDEMQQLYSNHSLSLNITELRNTYVLKKPIHKIHLRTFEIPMCGGIEIASHTDELATYFEDGKEIILYKSEEELLSKARFYLDIKNENSCLKIKKSARKRAESDHTWMNRFKVLDTLC